MRSHRVREEASSASMRDFVKTARGFPQLQETGVLLLPKCNNKKVAATRRSDVPLTTRQTLRMATMGSSDKRPMDRVVKCISDQRISRRRGLTTDEHFRLVNSGSSSEYSDDEEEDDDENTNKRMRRKEEYVIDDDDRREVTDDDSDEDNQQRDVGNCHELTDESIKAGCGTASNSRTSRSRPSDPAAPFLSVGGHNNAAGRMASPLSNLRKNLHAMTAAASALEKVRTAATFWHATTNSVSRSDFAGFEAPRLTYEVFREQLFRAVNLKLSHTELLGLALRFDLADTGFVDGVAFVKFFFKCGNEARARIRERDRSNADDKRETESLRVARKVAVRTLLDYSAVERAAWERLAKAAFLSTLLSTEEEKEAEIVNSRKNTFKSLMTSAELQLRLVKMYKVRLTEKEMTALSLRFQSAAMGYINGTAFQKELTKVIFYHKPNPTTKKLLRSSSFNASPAPSARRRPATAPPTRTLPPSPSTRSLFLGAAAAASCDRPRTAPPKGGAYYGHHHTANAPWMTAERPSLPETITIKSPPASLNNSSVIRARPASAGASNSRRPAAPSRPFSAPPPLKPKPIWT